MVEGNNVGKVGGAVKQNIYASITNFFKRLPFVGRLGIFGERSWVRRSGELIESPLSKKELGDLGQLNDNLIILLKEVEDRWNEVEALTWGGVGVEDPLIPPSSDTSKGVIGRTLFYRYREQILREITLFTRNTAHFRDTNLLAQHTNNENDLLENIKNNIKLAHGNDPQINATIDQYFDNNRANILSRLQQTRQYILEGETINLFPELGIGENPATGQRGWIGEETIYPLGWHNFESVKGHLAAAFQGFINIASGPAGTGRFSPDVLRTLTANGETLVNYVEYAYRGNPTPREVEGQRQTEGGERSHYSFLTGLRTPADRIDTIRGDLLARRPTYVRFQHTFMVIKSFIKGGKEVPYQEVVIGPDGEPEKDEQGNVKMVDKTRRENLYFTEATHTNWYPTQWEVEADAPPGYDENGYPLEINEQGEILLDKWWHEISRNEWQKNIISQKPGGDKILERINHFSNRANCRVIDRRWADPQYGDPYIDIVDMAAYIYVQYDAYRDDLRDGRHHKWSKSAMDYLIAAEGGFTVAPHLQSIMKRVVPTTPPGTLPYDENNSDDYINATPDLFLQGITDEEKSVVREYRLRLSDGANGQKGELIDNLIRKPTAGNPSFDRRALNRRGSFIHWGRMLYYEWQDAGINRWSENPFPHISTRGLAQYILDRTIRGLYSLEDQKRTIREVGKSGYDYGIRRPIVGGSKSRFPMDLLGGSDVVQEGDW